MAGCINMYSTAAEGMSPRISFSSDFAAEVPAAPRGNNVDRPTDNDFEFAVGGRPMMAADELFFKGQLLPLTRAPTPIAPVGSSRASTLRDELLTDEDDDNASVAASGATMAAARGHGRRWKEFLGLRRPSTSANTAAVACGATSSATATASQQCNRFAYKIGAGQEARMTDRAAMLLDNDEEEGTMKRMQDFWCQAGPSSRFNKNMQNLSHNEANGN